MSAIFGIFNRNYASVDSWMMENMSEVLAHRGSDQISIRQDNYVAIGNRLFATTPYASNGHISCPGLENRILITSDVRLDNRSELLMELGLAVPGTETVSDSEIVLNAYLKWGEDSPSHLAGDFAFVIWDARDQKLFGARDQFGIRSVFYHISSELFVFATEIKGVLVHPAVADRLNPNRIADHLRNFYDDNEQTFFVDVVRLPASSSFTVTRDKFTVRPYWKLTMPDPLVLKSDEEYAEAFREKFTNAVASRMRSSVPVGSMLSGGLDSSSITCVARDELKARSQGYALQTYSAVFDHVKECDERDFVNAVVAQNSIKSNFVVADDYGPFYDHEELLKFHDEPIGSSNLYMNWLSYKAARNKGTQVILDGYDGDTTVSHGLGYFAELAQSRRWVSLLSENIAYARRNNEFWPRTAWSWVWTFGLDPWMMKRGMPKTVRNHIRSKTLGSRGYEERAPRLNDAFAASLPPARPSKTKHVTFATERENHLWILTERGNPAAPIETLDYTSAALGIEVRYPFWDKALIEFCLSLPPQQKIRRGWTRLVLRNAMDGILPEKVQWRPGKGNMAPAFSFGMTRYCQELMNRFFLHESDLIQDYIDLQSLHEALDRHRLSTASVNDMMWLQRSLSLALWLRIRRSVNQH